MSAEITPLERLQHEPMSVGQWYVVAICIGILALDGVDGWLARRFGTETAFGGRFDMEVDAGVIAVLSVLAWVSGRGIGVSPSRSS